MLVAVVFAVGNVLFTVFYAEWIAYSVHWVIRRIVVVLMGCEMVSRLYLCPPAAFGKVTSIGGMLKTVGYFELFFLIYFVFSPFVIAEAH